MGMSKYDVHNELLLRRTMKVFDDFRMYVSTDEWTTVASGCSVAGADAEGGILTWTGDTTPNDYCYVKTTQKIFKFVNNNPLMCEAYIQFAEQNTNQQSVMFG